MEDVPKVLSLFDDISTQCTTINKDLQNLIGKVQQGELNTNKGISFLEVKYQLLLDYLINLTFVMLQKTQGETIVDSAHVQHIVEIRTILEKMRPIEQKLKYQIDKLLHTATTGHADPSDPMRLKARPENLVSKLDDDSDDDDDDNADDAESKPAKPKLYVPPKLAPMHYDGDDTQAERKSRQVHRAKQHALRGSLMQELRDEYSDAPHEIKESRDLHRVKADKQRKERQEYEESHFVRMTVSKKDRASMRRMNTMSSLDGITKFDNISALNPDSANMDMGEGQKKRKSSSSKGKKKGKTFKRRKTH